MARHAQPREVAELKGAHKKDPQRYRGEVPKHELPLGDAPVDLDEMEKRAWFELSAMVPPGVLTFGDAPMFKMACVLYAEFVETKRDFPIGKFSHLISLLARFGMSPADRQKIAIENPNKPSNPFADLDS